MIQLRADVTTNTVAHRELLTYEFNTVTPNSAVVSLIWEKKEIPFVVEVPVSEIVLAEFKKNSTGQLGFNRQNWETMAAYALNNNGDLNEALNWIDGAIAGNFYSQKTFNNLAIKAQILNKLGRTQEYASLMDEAASMANMNQLNNIGYQMLNSKDYERAIKYFKMNVDNNPTVANVHDSLGEAYKTIGDKDNAIKYFKKSLSMNPPANVKANSEKHLKELGAL
jgi:tetratricopeptide (TPR) repeat protein